MASPLDISVLQNFSPIFAFLFVFAVVFGVLSATKKFNSGINALIAVLLGVMALFSGTVVDTITTMAPWFVLLFIFSIFLIIAFMVFGVKEGDITGVFKSKQFGFVNFWVIILVVVIFIGSFSSVIAKHRAESGNETISSIDDLVSQDSFWGKLFNIKVLGAIVVLLIGMFAIQKLSYSP